MSKIFLKSIGKTIRQLRDKQGLSQENLASLIDMSRNAIGSIERGETNAPILTLYKIFKAMNINLKDCFKLEE